MFCEILTQLYYYCLSMLVHVFYDITICSVAQENHMLCESQIEMFIWGENSCLSAFKVTPVNKSESV